MNLAPVKTVMGHQIQNPDVGRQDQEVEDYNTLEKKEWIWKRVF